MESVNDEGMSPVAAPTRAQRAAQTRRRMVGAAYRLFVDRGYPGTTMVAVAEAAGVAVQTLYFTFGTKAQLLQHAYEFAVLGDPPTPPPAQPWYAALRRAEVLPDALAILVDNVAAVFARTAPLDEYVRAASFEPEAARVRAYNEQLRRDSWGDIIDILSTRFPLRADLDRERAVDMLMTVMSPSTYQTLVADCHWPPDQWNAWCDDAVQHHLFTAEASTPKRN
jgi:AcrR family transcriptional regulator